MSQEFSAFATPSHGGASKPGAARDLADRNAAALAAAAAAAAAARGAASALKPFFGGDTIGKIWENHRKTIGTWWFDSHFMGFSWNYPLVN